MIAYFADRTMNILGHATTELPEGLRLVDDLLTANVETGVDIFEGYLPYDAKTRKTAELCCDIGNYILLFKDGKSRFFTIINTEADTKRQEIYFYAEDAGLDLLNEYCITWEADQEYSLAWYVEYFTSDSGFEIGINEAVGLSLKLSFEEESAAERLAYVAAQFGDFEISFSFEIENLTVTKKLINIHKKRGEDYGVTLRLNREITRILTIKSIEELVTGLYPIGGVAEGASQYTTLLNYKYDDGDIYVSGNLLLSRDANAKWSRYIWNKEPNLEKLSGSIVKPKKYEETDQKALCELAIADLKKMREVEVNYEVDIAYLPDNVAVGDRVNIVDEAGELYLSTRILKLEESESKQKFTATLGEHLLKKSGISEKVEALAGEFARTSISVLRAEEISKAAKEMANAAKAEAKTAASGASDALAAAGDAATAASNATRAAELATETAQTAANAAVGVQESISGLNQTITEAYAAANNAYKAAETAQEKALTAEKAAQNAAKDAQDAKDAAETAHIAAQAAEEKAAAAQGSAADAIEHANTATETAAAAKADAEQAEKDVATLGDRIETVHDKMQTDYTRKTDFTETTANLQTEIKKNAAGISSNASMLLTVDETKNNAAAEAAAAEAAAATAQQQWELAAEYARTAKQAATEAAQNAQNAQNEANTAKAAADTAQSVADQAAADLAVAEADLATIRERVDATEEEIAAAESAFAEARDKAFLATVKANNAAEEAAAAQEVADTAMQNALNAQGTADEAANAALLAQLLAETASGDAAKAQKDADKAAKIAEQAQSKVEQAIADAETAQSIAENAANDARTAQEAADEAEKKAHDAAAVLFIAKQNLASIEERGDAAAEEVAAAQADVDSAQAAADTAQAEAEAAQASADTAKANAATAKAAAEAAHEAVGRAKAAADGALKAATDARASVDLLSVRTAQCETDISQNAEAIRLRATKTEVEETLGGYSTKEETYAAIETRADEISLSVNSVKEISDENAADIERAHTLLKVLESSVLSLVEDENGATLLTQTSTGWSYDFSAMQDLLADNAKKINQTGEYIKFVTYEDEPCIELGEGDSDFKVLITNTRIMFREGSQTPCFISNNEFVAENISVKEELRFGQWSWSARANGNFGLSWKGASE